MVWKKSNVFRGRYNPSGGKQTITTFENKPKREILEIGVYKTPSEMEYSDVAIRKHSWSQGKWKREEFFTKKEAWDYAKKYMKGKLKRVI